MIKTQNLTLEVTTNKNAGEREEISRAKLYKIKASSGKYLEINTKMSVHKKRWRKTERTNEPEQERAGSEWHRGAGGDVGEGGGDSLAPGGVEAQGSERARETGQMTAPLEGSVVHSLPSFSSLNAYFHHFA